MEKKKEMRNLKALNAVTLLSIMVPLIDAMIYFVGKISLVYLILPGFLLLLDIFAVILNFIHKNGSAKVTVIVSCFQLVLIICYDLQHNLSVPSMFLKCFLFLLPFLLTVSSFCYIIKPTKFSLVIANIFLAMSLSCQVSLLITGYSIKRLDALLIIIFIFLVVNLAYKNVKISNADNTEAYMPNMNVKQENVINENLPETIKQYKALLDEGIISQDEYEKKKKELLGF